MNICPVCGFDGIPPGRSQCPQCDADLTGFKTPDSLPDAPTGRQRGSQKQLIWMGGLGVLAVAVIIGLLVENLYRIRRIELLLEGQRPPALSSSANLDDKPWQPSLEGSKPDRSARSGPPAALEGPGETDRETIRKHPIPPAPPREIQAADRIPDDAPSAVPGVADEPYRAKTEEIEPTSVTITQPQARPGKDGGAADHLAGIAPQTPPAEDPASLRADDPAGGTAVDSARVSSQTAPTIDLIVPQAQDKTDAAGDRLAEIAPQTPPAEDPAVLQANEELPVPRISVGIESPESAFFREQGSITATIPALESPAGLPPAGAASVEPEFWIYDARGGEKFWDIAARFYGAGRYYPVLMEHNPEIGLFGVGAGVRMKVLKDAGQAEEILRRIVKIEGGRLIWYYTVMKGDTMESIARKYYNSDKRMSRLLDLNPGLKLQPGKQIRIQLD